MLSSRSSLLFAVMTMTVSAVLATGATAQEGTAPPSPPVSRPAPAPPRPLLPLLRAAEYDPIAHGPLLFVVPGPFVPPPASLPATRVSLTGIAAAMNLRQVAVGGINAVVPRTMTVLNTKPGKANPFGDLQPAETLKMLLASLTPEQWRVAGSANGIGSTDLTADQRLLWTQMLPEQTRVHKKTVRAGDAPGQWKFTDQSIIETRPRDGGRIRLSKAVTLQFFKVGANDTSWMSDP